MRSIRRNPLLKFLVPFCVILFVTLALSEIALRAAGYAVMYFYDPIYTRFEGGGGIPFVLKPNLRNARAHGNVRINTDELGLRRLAPEKLPAAKGADEFRVAIVGDSVTFGYGVETRDTYPNVLEQMLGKARPGRRVTVYNFGVSSYSVKEMAATVKLRTPLVLPDLVVAGVIYGDFDVSRTPGLDADGYNTHGETSRILSRYPRVKNLLRELHITYAIRDLASVVRSSSKEKAGAPELPDSYRHILEMRDASEGRGVPFLLLLLPSLEGDGSQFAVVKEASRKNGVNTCDLSTLTTLFTPDEFKAGRFDFHPSGRVHYRIAKMLAGHILEHYPR